MELVVTRDFDLGVTKLYENCRIYGPYVRKDGRKHVIAVFADGKRKTVSYPKFLMENHLGRHLTKDETVDHIDSNFTNDSLENLRVIGLKDHVSDDVKRLKPQIFWCPECGGEFSLSGRKLHEAIWCRRNGKAGPFCTKSCAGRYGTRVQKGMPPLDVVQINPEYTTKKLLRSLQGVTPEVQAAKTGKPYQ